MQEKTRGKVRSKKTGKTSSFYLLSLGCPKNLADSEKLTRRLRLKGFSQAPGPEGADALIVNTCGFIEAAKRESIDEILRLARLKDDAKGKKGRTNKKGEQKKQKLLVFGCLAQRYREELRRELPEVDAIWGTEAEEEIADYLAAEAGSGAGEMPPEEARQPSYMPSTFPYAYLKLSEGCKRRCTFCSIPMIRGPLRNFSPDAILGEAQGFIKAGIRELVLVSQDTASYRFKGYGLKELVRDISSISGDFWVRLHYLHPSGVDEGLLDAMAGEKKIVKYLDMPLQHSEARILGLMGRGGRGKEYFFRLIGGARRMMPGLAVRSSFIVGFPGETREEFEGLLDFIRRAGFEHAGAFVYSREDGTSAAALKGQLPQAVKNRRYDRFMSAQAEISLGKNQALTGRKLKAIVDEVDGDAAICRLASQAPEVDGVVFAQMGGKAVKPGDFVRVLITEAYDYDLKGRLLG